MVGLSIQITPVIGHLEIMGLKNPKKLIINLMSKNTKPVLRPWALR